MYNAKLSSPQKGLRFKPAALQVAFCFNYLFWFPMSLFCSSLSQKRYGAIDQT